MTKTLHDYGDEIYGPTPPAGFAVFDSYPWWYQLLAADMDVDQRTVRRWLNGSVTPPASVYADLQGLVAVKARIRERRNKKGG